MRDVNPGEAILITAEGKMISRQCVNGTISPCIFEYIYLARPDSTLNGISVYEFQLELGRRLARRIKARDWEIDVVVPVPDGSRPSAIEIAHELEMPYREACGRHTTHVSHLSLPYRTDFTHGTALTPFKCLDLSLPLPHTPNAV